jgi:integrase
MIAMLIGCGLRRGELLALRVDSIQSREEHSVIAELLSKAGHIRTVPIPSCVKVAIDEWKEAGRITEGALCRSINKTGRVWGTGMTKGCGRWTEPPRRVPGLSWARLCHLAGGELDQIQFLLGHVSIQTTERYLGCKQKLRFAVNGRMGSNRRIRRLRTSARGQ